MRARLSLLYRQFDLICALASAGDNIGIGRGGKGDATALLRALKKGRSAATYFLF